MFLAKNLIFRKFRRMAFSITENDYFDFLRFFCDKVTWKSDFFEKTFPKIVQWDFFDDY